MHHILESKSGNRFGKRGRSWLNQLGWLSMICSGILAGCQKSPEITTAAGTSPPQEKSTQAPSNITTEPVVEEFPKNDAPPQLPPISRDLPKDFACGEHRCMEFESARDVLVPLLLHEKPRVIGLGEAHAPAGFQGETTVSRFATQLLPTFSEGTSYLLIELLAPPASGCDEEKKEAQKESEVITQGQSKNNQNEYLSLGNQAREQGVVPDILRASCEDMKKIAAKDGGVLAYMETIGRLFSRDINTRLSQTKKGRPFVVAYGGALHNDATPRQGREDWSYARAVQKMSEHAYLEIDLVIPELITDSESWRSFPWYTAYQELPHKNKTLLIKWGEHSYTLLFAPSP